jgi:hypothetical protein
MHVVNALNETNVTCCTAVAVPRRIFMMRSRILMGRGSGRSVAEGIVVVVAVMRVTMHT